MGYGDMAGGGGGAPTETGTPGSGVTVVEQGSGPFNRTVISLDALSVGWTQSDDGAIASKLLYQFPPGPITILGCVMALGSFTFQSNVSDFNAKVSVGQDPQGTLDFSDSPEFNILGNADTVVAFVENTAAGSNNYGTAGSRLLGEDSAKEVRLNLASTDTNAVGKTMGISGGAVTILWARGYTPA